MKIRKANINDKNIIRNFIIKSDIYHYDNCPSFAKNYDLNPIKHYNQSYYLIDKININDFYIIEIYNIPIGTIMCWNNNGEITLINFYIDYKYRNLGYGNKLLKYVVNKYNYCVLGVFEENKKALNFYINFGFKIIQNQSTNSGQLLWLKYERNSNVDNI